MLAGKSGAEERNPEREQASLQSTLRPGLPPRALPSLTPSPWAPSLPSEALGEPQICYILDAILFLYGIILTLLYCRLKVRLGRWVGQWWQHGFEEEPTKFGGKGAGPLTLLLLMTFLYSRSRCERQL